MNRGGYPFLLKTTVGTFKASISPSNTVNLQTREQQTTSYTITIGGKNQCVQIKVMNDTTVTSAELLSVKTSFGDCEMYGLTIRSEKTVHMILLAITIMCTEFSHIQTLKLLDTSSFICEFDNGSKQGISLTLYEILFHGASWYEKRFGAKLLNSNLHNQYIESIKNFINPEYKSQTFDFNNIVLNDKLMPIYSTTNTWRDFLQKIYKLNNTCQIVAPWYKYALTLILNNILYEGQWWTITLQQNEKIYEIPYEYQPFRGGNRRNKNFPITRRTKFQYIEPLTYGEMYTLPYSTIKFDRIRL